jgi:hypothetical protein
MRVRVSARRIGGRSLPWNQKPKEYQGTLLSTRKTNDDRMVVVLFLGGPENERGPHLYEPRVTSVLGDEIRIVGLEKCEQAWVLQEWQCEILTTRD